MLIKKVTPSENLYFKVGGDLRVKKIFVHPSYYMGQ